MVTFMNDKQIKTLDDIRSFLTGTAEVEFSIEDKAERYRWIPGNAGAISLPDFGQERSRSDAPLFAAGQRLFTRTGYAPGSAIRQTRKDRSRPANSDQVCVGVYHGRYGTLGRNRRLAWPTLRCSHQETLRADVRGLRR